MGLISSFNSRLPTPTECQLILASIIVQAMFGSNPIKVTLVQSPLF